MTGLVTFFVWPEVAVAADVIAALWCARLVVVGVGVALFTNLGHTVGYNTILTRYAVAIEVDVVLDDTVTAPCLSAGVGASVRGI
jgi:hypothetical protein